MLVHNQAIGGEFCILPVQGLLYVILYCKCLEPYSNKQIFSLLGLTFGLFCDINFFRKTVTNLAFVAA